MNSNSVVLIEIGGSHDECLLTQMHAIKSLGHEIVLICTNNIKDRNPTFKNYVNEFHTVDLSHGRGKENKEIKNIWRLLENSGVETVIFNTAQGNHVRKLCLYALFNKIEFIGIIHTTLKFKGSFTQRIINLKIKRYLLLSEHLLSSITPPRGITVDYFYPIRFPSFDKKIKKETAVITIIGGVESRRSDLPGFLRMLIATKDLDVSFMFLGGTDHNDEGVIALKNQLKHHKLMDKVMFFDSFVPQEIFDAHLHNTDLILPLIHPNTPSSDQYFKNQISGAMSVSFGYKIPLLIHEAYKSISEMKAASFYYNEENFPRVLVSALDESNNKSREMRAGCRYDVNQQEYRYTKFIFPGTQENSKNPCQITKLNDVAVILINYNSSNYTLNCIDSILNNTSNSLKYQIVVIDNASNHEDYKKLETKLDKIDKKHNIYLFRNKINLGFSGGNMLGIQFSSAKYYFFLNNDCILQNDCLNILFKFCENNTEVAQCSPQLYNKNGEHQPCFDYFPYLITKIFSLAVLRFTYGKRFIKRKDIYSDPVQVDVVSGSQMFIRSEPFHEIGGFDTTFFLYCEEEDIALRLSSIGYSTYLVPEARNTHIGGGSTVQSLNIKKEFYISFLYFYRKHFGLIKQQILKLTLILRLFKKSFMQPENIKLCAFLASGAHLKHSLKHKQKIIDNDYKHERKQDMQETIKRSEH